MGRRAHDPRLAGPDITLSVCVVLFIAAFHRCGRGIVLRTLALVVLLQSMFITLSVVNDMSQVRTICHRASSSRMLSLFVIKALLGSYRYGPCFIHTRWKLSSRREIRIDKGGYEIIIHLCWGIAPVA